MVIIKEKNGKFLNFFKPLMVIGVGGMLLNFLSILISLIILLLGPSFSLDIIITNLIILLLAQIIGIFIVYFVIIPLFKAKSVEYHKLNFFNFLRTLLLICGTFTVIVSINLILYYLISVFHIVPQSGYSNILLNSGHLANPLNILIYYLPLTVGAPIYEELVYRRLLIPLLEKRGMQPFTAILSSSVLFAIAHLPSDLVNGNLAGGILHIIVVFFIGISLGLIYVVTRNVIFPIIIHGVLNFISFSSPIIILLGNNGLALIYNFIYWTIFIAGFGVLFYGLWQFFRKKEVEWVVFVRKKSSNKVLLGLIGFIIMGIVIVFIPLMLDFASISSGLVAYNVLLYFIIITISYAIFLIVFSWLGTRTRYESNI